MKAAAPEHRASLHVDIPPCVNQVERHPLLPNWELLDYCASHGIVMQAHTPSAREIPGCCRIRRSRGKRREWTHAGAGVRAVEPRHGVALAPKCSTAAHAKEIHAAADASGGRVLTPEHMAWLDAVTPPGASGTRWITGGPPGGKSFMRGGPKAHLYGW